MPSPSVGAAVPSRATPTSTPNAPMRAPWLAQLESGTLESRDTEGEQTA